MLKKIFVAIKSFYCIHFYNPSSNYTVVIKHKHETGTELDYEYQRF